MEKDLSKDSSLIMGGVEKVGKRSKKISAAWDFGGLATHEYYECQHLKMKYSTISPTLSSTVGVGLVYKGIRLTCGS